MFVLCRGEDRGWDLFRVLELEFEFRLIRVYSIERKNKKEYDKFVLIWDDFESIV